MGGRAVAEPELDRSAIEAELARVLASAPFERSQQVARFLRYIVDAKLRGDEAAIKAYAVAVDVFGRPQNFDQQTDPIVRVQARRLRGMLEAFYALGPSPFGVELRLPIGRYVPDFLPSDTAPQAPPPAQDSESRGRLALAATPASASAPDSVPAETPASRAAAGWLLALALAPSAILVVLVVIWGAIELGWLYPGPPRTLSRPVIEIGEFVPVPSWGGDYVSVPGLAVELVSDLQLFGDADARLMASDAETPGVFQLTGLVRPEGARVLVTATLRRGGTEAVVWSHSVVVPLSLLSDQIDEVSQRLAEQLGATAGPLHKPGYDWLQSHPDAFRSGDPYLCRLLIRSYIAGASAETAQNARACAQAELLLQPDSAEALVTNAVLRLATEAQQRPPGSYSIESRAVVNSALLRARNLGGTSAFVWFGVGLAYDQLGQRDKAIEAYRNALQLNPADLDIRAALARCLVLSGASTDGTSMAMTAIAHSAIVPGWYRIAPAVDGLRKGDNGFLLRQAQLAAEGDSELGAVLAAVAGRRLGQAMVLDRYLAQALEGPRIRRYGILPVLRTWVADPELLRTIAAEISLAADDPVTDNASGA